MGLASHLPWLLHLLLLTGVGSASMAAEASSARTAEASHEASENLSATTVQQSASPGAAADTGTRPPQGLSGRSLSGKHDSNCTSLGSSQLSNRSQVGSAPVLPSCIELLSVQAPGLGRLWWGASHSACAGLVCSNAPANFLSACQYELSVKSAGLAFSRQQATSENRVFPEEESADM